MNCRRIGCQARGRSGLPVAGNRAVDQFGMRPRQRLVIEVEALHHAGAEILHQEIAGGDEAVHDLLRLGPLQVEHDALLAGVKLPERGRHAAAQRRAGAHHVALIGLDLDHVGAEIGHHPGAIRAGDRGGEIHHAHAVQRACHHTAFPLGRS